MAGIAQYKQLGRLNEPVVFEVSEGPSPGPVSKAVQHDSPAPAEAGLKPITVILLGLAMAIGGYLILRPLVE